MYLPLTEEALARVQWLDSSPSTNGALRELVTAQVSDTSAAQLPHGTLIATANQTEGRGRMGRGWETPAGHVARRIVADSTGRALQHGWARHELAAITRRFGHLESAATFFSG